MTFFSVLADEATDSSNKEQLPLVLRYVDSTYETREEFVEYVECAEGISGTSIATYINTTHKMNLDLKNCIGQCYHGAGNMSGKCKGAAAVIKKDYPMAKYFHCSSHKLNLCVVKCCSLAKVRNMMDTLGEITRYFNYSPKREGLLIYTIKEICDNHQTNKKLLDVCQTRWIPRLDALEVFRQLFEPIITTLDQIRNNEERHWNSESVSKASSYYHSLTNFDFLMTLTVTAAVLNYTKALTVKLQKQSVNDGSAFHEVDTIISTLQDVRENVETYTATWFKSAEELATTFEISVARQRTCGRQQHRPNIPSESIQDYYRMNLCIPLLDQINEELRSRFQDGQAVSLDGFFAIPEEVINRKGWSSSFLKFCQAYESLLPSMVSLEAEIQLWDTKWRRCEDACPATLQDTLKTMDKDMYPNIHKALIIQGTIPVTTCECERSVRALRRLKTYNRSTMTQSRLNGLALMHVHYT